jgi:hypothetical protein
VGLELRRLKLPTGCFGVGLEVSELELPGRFAFTEMDEAKAEAAAKSNVVG